MSNEGRRVRVHYTGTLDDGTVFDTSYKTGVPLTFDCGSGNMISGFDAAVRDMEVGETKTVHLEPEEAYGQPNPKLIQTVAMEFLPGSEALEVGQTITLRGHFGQTMQAMVWEKDDKNITLNMNHHLAGKPLNFEITLLEVWDAPVDEYQPGKVVSPTVVNEDKKQRF